MSTASGAAFEDLLATDLPNGRNLADEYLHRHGWKETTGIRDYITGLRRAVVSLHEVSEVVPGDFMLLRDLVRQGVPVRVSEKSGSRGLRQRDRIATRVVHCAAIASSSAASATSQPKQRAPSRSPGVTTCRCRRSSMRYYKWLELRSAQLQTDEARAVAGPVLRRAGLDADIA